MKRKFSKILGVGLTLALLASMLVMAGPVAADSPADTDVGFLLGEQSATCVEWSTEKAEAVGAMGGYSVKLENDSNDGGNSVEFIPPAGTTLSDLGALTNEWSFWHNFDETGGHGPQLELTFRETSGTGWFEITVVNQTPGAAGGEGEWFKQELTGTSIVGIGGNTPDGSSVFEWGLDYDLAGIEADMVTLFNTAEPDSGAATADYQLTLVQAEMYEADGPIGYIDDITIDGTTYELEPLFLDAEYYSVGDTVEVTVPNFGANTDSFRVNPVAGEIPADPADDNWSISVNSSSDSGTDIIVALEETGANTGVFTASFGTSGTPPVAEDEVYVEDGATITVTYTPSDPWWGAGTTSVVPTITAMVDVTVPTITSPSPADGDTTADTLTVISVSYNGGTSAIDQTSVEMFVDTVEVTDDATVGASSVTYTPTEDLAEGSHDVTVNVADNAGNEATLSWDFRVASWLIDPVSDTDVASLDQLTTVGVAVSITGDLGDITVGRYASNPQPEVVPAFDMIEDGFFDVKVINFNAGTATQIVIKFADTAITAESTAHVWDDLEGAWLECSDQGYNSLDEYLWIKVRDDTTPNIAELEGTPFAIGGEPTVSDISAYYKGYSGDAEVVETTDLLKAANDWAGAVVPSGFTEAISTTELLALANEWAAN